MTEATQKASFTKGKELKITAIYSISYILVSSKNKPKKINERSLNNNLKYIRASSTKKASEDAFAAGIFFYSYFYFLLVLVL